MNATVEPFAQALAHRFNDESLLVQALTHRSYSKNHNETLEFIGDAALGLIIACSLRQRFPTAAEGELSRLRARLVKRDTLAAIAAEHGISDSLLLGSGELASGGRQRSSILADALEAVIGAVHLDGGYSAAESLVNNWFASRLAKLKLGDSKDAKTRLQELLQARQLPLPNYTVSKTEGEQHQQVFFVICAAAAKHSEGRGVSRRKAEQDAAHNMLQLLGSA